MKPPVYYWFCLNLGFTVKCCFFMILIILIFLASTKLKLSWKLYIFNTCSCFQIPAFCTHILIYILYFICYVIYIFLYIFGFVHTCRSGVRTNPLSWKPSRSIKVKILVELWLLKSGFRLNYVPLKSIFWVYRAYDSRMEFSEIFLSVYGLTESSPVTNHDGLPPKLGTIGNLIPNTLGKVCFGPRLRLFNKVSLIAEENTLLWAAILKTRKQMSFLYNPGSLRYCRLWFFVIFWNEFFFNKFIVCAF